jgi:EmrB/QacA subfamily drug resistance transporter
MNSTTTPSLKPSNRNAIVIVFIIGAFVAILNQTLLITALPHIMRSFNITANKAQWLTTAFMLTNGIFIPITAFLIERYSTRSLFIFSMGIFAVGTLVAALSPNFSILLIARILQAVGAGALMPLMQTVFLVIFPKEKRGAAMGMIGLVISFAPAIGPTLSGWIVDSFSWNYLFYIILPIAIIDLVVALFILKNVTEPKEANLDILSVILSVVGFGGILYGFSTAGSDGWTDRWVIGTIVVGAVSLGLFVLRQLKIDSPILEFRVFKNRTFAVTTALSMIIFALMMGIETILPLYTQTMRGISALHSGLILLPGAIIMAGMSPVVGIIFDKIGSKLLAIIGLTIITITTFILSYLKLDTSITFIVIVYAVRMAGVSMVMMPLITAGINALPNKFIAHATVMNNTFRQVGGSIGTAVLITVMSNVAKNGKYTNPINAQIAGMNSAFIIAAIVSLLALLLVFLLKSDKKTTENEEVLQEVNEG